MKAHVIHPAKPDICHSIMYSAQTDKNAVEWNVSGAYPTTQQTQPNIMISNCSLNKKCRFVNVGVQASVSGNHQIVALDVFVVETDGMGCTVADHCYYGHTVRASYGKCFL